VTPFIFGLFLEDGHKIAEIVHNGGKRKLFPVDLSVSDSVGAVPNAIEWTHGALLTTSSSAGSLIVKLPETDSDIPAAATVTLSIADVPGQPNPYSSFVQQTFSVSSLPRTVNLPPVSTAGSASFIASLAVDGQLSEDRVRVRVVDVDVCVDSLNVHGYDLPEPTPEVESIEDNSALPGKIIMVNDNDLDGDSIPDFADGYALFPDTPSSIDCPGKEFAPLVITIPDSIDVQTARFWLYYNASDPLQVTTNAAGIYELPPDGGHLRLWNVDGDVPRNANSLWNHAAGNYVPPTPAEGISAETLGFTDTLRQKTLYIEGIRPSQTAGDQRIRFRVAPDWELTGTAAITIEDAVRVTIVNAHLIPDFNRDLKIDDDDKNLLITKGPFRFWVNDDNDSGYDGGDDIPGQSGGMFGSANYNNNRIDGVRDLVDVFPVLVDLSKAVSLLHPDQYAYRLKHASGAINAAPTVLLRGYTDDESTRAGAYMKRLDVASFLVDVPVLQQITPAGILIPEIYLMDALATGEGFILLCEGRAETLQPLVLEIRKKTDQTIVYTAEMPLSLSGVEQMFRHKNLRDVADGDSTVADRDEASNYPDSLCSSKWLVFVHGFIVSEQNARGWHSEMFKRFYWSGSRAKFCAVTWYGNQKALVDPLYQENVNNAFMTAEALSEYVQQLGDGEKIVLAHSLGNMVVSSAITDHQMAVSKYFMADAAVATEAYESSTYVTVTDSNRMLHPEWRDYPSRSWASEWHKLFLNHQDDARSNLTWRARFDPAVNNAFNFYSSEDQVFEIYDDVLYMTTGLQLVWGWPIVQGEDRYAWHKQELFKGTKGLIGLGATDQAGWGFRTKWVDDDEGQSWLENWYAPEDIDNVTDQQLRDMPAFRPNPAYMFGPEISTEQQNSLLAKAIPALSHATGRNLINTFELYGNRNFDMSQLYKNGWPRNHPIYGQQWLHNDIREMAYLHVFKVFDVMVNEGGLQ
jgi:hypothetical protein